MSKWSFQGTPVEALDPAMYAFVYCITHKATGRAYIGKKLLFFKGHKQVKGKKKKILKESDWRTYNGSSTELETDVGKFGEDAFSYEILRFCRTKGEANYYELREQMYHDVLLYPNKWYNSYVGARIHRNHVLKKGSY